MVGALLDFIWGCLNRDWKDDGMMGGSMAVPRYLGCKAFDGRRDNANIF